MGETTRFTIEGFPMDKLPEELHDRLNSVDPVSVTIEQRPAEAEEKPPRDLHEMRGFAKGLYASEGIDPVEFIRQLRDEWDD